MNEKKDNNEFNKSTQEAVFTVTLVTLTLTFAYIVEYVTDTGIPITRVLEVLLFVSCIMLTIAVVMENYD